MTDPGHISFGHRPGGRGHQTPTRERHPWAVLAGYGDCAHWLGPHRTDKGSPSPVEGQTGVLHLRHPFVGRVGVPFWALSETEEGWNNGYVDGPSDAGELAALRFLRCRILQPPVAHTDPGVMTATADVLDVITPGDLMTLPPSQASVRSVATGLKYRPETARHGPLSYIVSNIEGDIVNWALLHQGSSGIHLLAYGESGFHEDFVYAGNRPLASSDVAAFPLD